jgi:hypothetical protein
MGLFLYRQRAGVSNIFKHRTTMTPDKENKMTRSKTDSRGRVWNYCDGEGSWSNGKHTIGCGRNNGSKWQIWDGPSRGYYEYKTLKEAMEACE